MRSVIHIIGRGIFTFTLIWSASRLDAQDLDLSGWKVVQANSASTLTFGLGTSIKPGGYLIIARNAPKTQFQTFWGVTLASNVTYINGTDLVGGSGFPVINGSENYTLENASSTVVDGP